MYKTSLPDTGSAPGVFASELLPGEPIVWWGQPNAHVFFHPEDAQVIPFSLLWGGFFIFWTLEATGVLHDVKNGFGWFGWVWGTPFVISGQYLIWGRFLHMYWLKKRTYYAFTDSRALVVVLGFSGRQSSAAYLADLAMLDKRVTANGNGSISFGAPYDPIIGMGRRSSSYVRPLTFDDVDEVDSVYAMLCRLKDSHKPRSAEPKIDTSNMFRTLS